VFESLAILLLPRPKYRIQAISGRDPPEDAVIMRRDLRVSESYAEPSLRPGGAVAGQASERSHERKLSDYC